MSVALKKFTKSWSTPSRLLDVNTFIWARYSFSFVMLSISILDGIFSVNVRFVNTSKAAALRTFSFLVFTITKR
jgi:hypothetical protein